MMCRILILYIKFLACFSLKKASINLFYNFYFMETLSIKKIGNILNKYKLSYNKTVYLVNLKDKLLFEYKDKPKDFDFIYNLSIIETCKYFYIWNKYDKTFNDYLKENQKKFNLTF